MINELGLLRARTAAELAKAYGQDRCDAFEKALERFDAQQKRAPELRSWSDRILNGDSVIFNPDDSGENWVEVVWAEYCDEELADEMVADTRICSPYDCTGQAFIYDVRYFKAFNGYVVMAYWALDV